MNYRNYRPIVSTLQQLRVVRSAYVYRTTICPLFQAKFHSVEAEKATSPDDKKFNVSTSGILAAYAFEAYNDPQYGKKAIGLDNTTVTYKSLDFIKQTFDGLLSIDVKEIKLDMSGNPFVAKLLQAQKNPELTKLLPKDRPPEYFVNVIPHEEFLTDHPNPALRVIDHLNLTLRVTEQTKQTIIAQPIASNYSKTGSNDSVFVRNARRGAIEINIFDNALIGADKMISRVYLPMEVVRQVGRAGERVEVSVPLFCGPEHAVLSAPELRPADRPSAEDLVSEKKANWWPWQQAVKSEKERKKLGKAKEIGGNSLWEQKARLFSIGSMSLSLAWHDFQSLSDEQIATLVQIPRNANKHPFEEAVFPTGGMPGVCPWAEVVQQIVSQTSSDKSSDKSLAGVLARSGPLRCVLHVDNLDTDTQLTVWHHYQYQYHTVVIAFRGTDMGRTGDLVTDLALRHRAFCPPEHIARAAALYAPYATTYGTTEEEGLRHGNYWDSLGSAIGSGVGSGEEVQEEVQEEVRLHEGFVAAYQSVQTALVQHLCYLHTNTSRDSDRGSDSIYGSDRGSDRGIGSNGIYTNNSNSIYSNGSGNGMYVTGHSLGGALATVCAFDLARIQHTNNSNSNNTTTNNSNYNTNYSNSNYNTNYNHHNNHHIPIPILFTPCPDLLLHYSTHHTNHTNRLRQQREKQREEDDIHTNTIPTNNHTTTTAHTAHSHTLQTATEEVWQDTVNTWKQSLSSNISNISTSIPNIPSIPSMSSSISDSISSIPSLASLSSLSSLSSTMSSSLSSLSSLSSYSYSYSLPSLPTNNNTNNSNTIYDNSNDNDNPLALSYYLTCYYHHTNTMYNNNNNNSNSNSILVYSYGSPRVGNRAFATLYRHLLPTGTTYRVVNQLDLVPRLPLHLTNNTNGNGTTGKIPEDDTGNLTGKLRDLACKVTGMSGNSLPVSSYFPVDYYHVGQTVLVGNQTIDGILTAYLTGNNTNGNGYLTTAVDGNGKWWVQGEGLPVCPLDEEELTGMHTISLTGNLSTLLTGNPFANFTGAFTGNNPLTMLTGNTNTGNGGSGITGTMSLAPLLGVLRDVLSLPVSLPVSLPSGLAGKTEEDTGKTMPVTGEQVRAMGLVVLQDLQSLEGVLRLKQALYTTYANAFPALFALAPGPALEKKPGNASPEDQAREEALRQVVGVLRQEQRIDGVALGAYLRLVAGGAGVQEAGVRAWLDAQVEGVVRKMALVTNHLEPAYYRAIRSAIDNNNTSGNDNAIDNSRDNNKKKKKSE